MTARHGVHLFADVGVVLYVALERSVVNSGKRLEQPFLRNGIVFAPIVLMFPSGNSQILSLSVDLSTVSQP